MITPPPAPPRDWAAQTTLASKTPDVPTPYPYTSVTPGAFTFMQPATNFIGRRSYTPFDNGPVDRRYHPEPLAGVWRAEEHIPIMRTTPVLPKFQ